MFKFAKLLVTLSALGFVSAYANYSDNDIPPLHDSGYYFGSFHGLRVTGGGLWARFSNNDTTYAFLQTNTPDFTVSIRNSHNLNTTYQWGYNLGIGYFYECTDNAIDLSYTLLNAKDTSSVTSLRLFSPIFEPALSPATATGDYSYSALSLTAGHLSRFLPFFDFYFYLGADYVHFSRNFRRFVFAADQPPLPDHLSTSFNGIGPTFGVSANAYPFCQLPGFSIFGLLQSSFPYGEVNDSSVTTSNFFTTGTFVTTFSSSAPVKGIQPTFTGKLALSYFMPFSRGFGLRASGGYQAMYLFNQNISIGGVYFSVTGSV